MTEKIAVCETRVRMAPDPRGSADADFDVRNWMNDVYATGCSIPDYRQLLREREPMLIGYARVSTDDQSLDLQIDAMKEMGIEDKWIFQESISGFKDFRPEWTACLRALRDGDTLIVYKLDRMSRSMQELVEIMGHLEKNNIQFKSITESIDTTGPMGKLVFHLFAAIAEFERSLISERTKAGLAAARKRGRVGGRKPKLDRRTAQRAKKMLEDDPQITHEEAAHMFHVSRATLYRTWKRYGIEFPPPDRMDTDEK